MNEKNIKTVSHKLDDSIFNFLVIIVLADSHPSTIESYAICRHGYDKIRVPYIDEPGTGNVNSLRPSDAYMRQ